MAHLLITERLRRPWAVWCAVLVALLMALAPTLAQATSFLRAPLADPFQVCTTQGLQTFAAPGAQDGQGPHSHESSPAQSHCPFCLHPTDRFVLPPEPISSPSLGMGGYRGNSVLQAFFYSDNSLLWARRAGHPPLSLPKRASGPVSRGPSWHDGPHVHRMLSEKSRC